LIGTWKITFSPKILLTVETRESDGGYKGRLLGYPSVQAWGETEVVVHRKIRRIFSKMLTNCLEDLKGKTI